MKDNIFLKFGAGIVAILLVVWFNKSPNDQSKHVNKDVQISAPVVSKFDAYGMACEFVKRQKGLSPSSKFEMGTDECKDAGPNEWIIVGYANGEKFTVDLRYDGKDWSLVNPIAFG